MSHPPRVAVLIETSTSWGKDAVKGIVDYVRSSSRWMFAVDWRGVHEQLRLPPGWRGEGIIARVTSRELARQIDALGVPAINISWSIVPGSNLPQVVADERAISRMAADHFIERGFRNFAYVGDADQRYYDDQCEPTFKERVTSRGGDYWKFQPRRARGKARTGLAKFATIASWLKRLPKPVAVFAWDAVRGRLVTEACWKSGLRVPEEVSVLVGYDDKLMCEISMPPLSGIDDRPEIIGYTAAELLDRLMRREKTSTKPRLIPPAGIVARRSTDTLAHEDPKLAAAIAYIRDHADRPIWVRDVLKTAPMSRRSLEQRFLEALGRTPAAEIRRIHLQRARELLINTEMPVAKIATASGYLHAEVMTRAFRREFGVSPLAFRKRFRTH